MQFGGQRTDLDLKPIGEPDNFLIKLGTDVLPQPDAILTHGITPQKTITEGIGEPQFLTFLTEQIAAKGTIFVGYNNIRFDDEFIRFSLWRNFFDAYEWQWQQDSSRWDLLDVVRMTRALRPKGIEWPYGADGKPTAKLEAVAAINKLGHDSVHDALSDVAASIAVARLIKLKQPKLFDFLLGLRKKNEAEVLVNSRQPLLYTSGRYPSDNLKTTVAIMVGSRADRPGALMYDLRTDPTDFIELTPAELAKLWSDRRAEAPYFPVKTLSYNRCPAIAPLSVLDQATIKRLQLDMKKVAKHQRQIAKASDFGDNLNKALAAVQPPKQPRLVVSEDEVDGLLYDGFVSPTDKTKMSVVRAASDETIAGLALDFDDERLKVLLPLYKARNFPESLSEKETVAWQNFRHRRLVGGRPSRADIFFKRIDELSQKPMISGEHKSMLQELAIWSESILPV